MKKTLVMCFISLVIGSLITAVVGYFYTRHNNESWIQTVLEDKYEVKYPDSALMAKTIYLASSDLNYDYRLLMAQIQVETEYRCRTEKTSGAEGCMQIRKKYWKDTCKDYDISDKYQNIFAGVCAMKHYSKATGNVADALIAYNIGITSFKQEKNLLEGFTYRNSVINEYTSLQAYVITPRVK
mgnify:CR=1 FL=1